jgi:DNA-directed RNA polymerase specialized sigma24 family protein
LPTDPTHTEQLLLNQVSTGDETAFRSLFHQYWDNIYGVALMLTRSETMAEDMVQEIFLNLWAYKDRLPAERFVYDKQ